MHQLLDSDSRVASLARCDQNIEKVWRSGLELINVYRGIQKGGWPPDPILADKRKLGVGTPSQSPLWVEPRPADGRVEIEAHHLRSRASICCRLCRERPCTLPRTRS